MNLNVVAYMVYLSLMLYIIIYVGRYFYTNGRVFILSLFGGNTDIADYINRILLIGYYLLNIGYTFIKLKAWQQVLSVQDLISSLAGNMGLLILILASIHYVNMTVIYLFSKSNSLTHKSTQS